MLVSLFQQRSSEIPKEVVLKINYYMGHK